MDLENIAEVDEKYSITETNKLLEKGWILLAQELVHRKIPVPKGNAISEYGAKDGTVYRDIVERRFLIGRPYPEK